ncbi:hypothetical protein HDF16_006227 [Granulicella aggregans]|uniref:Uncharacterized protein n=1 Tax=Granulicella aggregans TaxID=474949 RepID=A0A7W7ZKA6_9BACT|nr:hypothetical protein [Granulicella aggregans]MBB5061491.1 hypothetical protein [Granulicella aggregans]
MVPPPMICDWARRLIASEVDAGSLQVQSELATLRVYEKLRTRFCAPVGVDAFHALASRALYLAKSQFPTLDAVNVTGDGGLHGLGEREGPLRGDDDLEVGIILIAQMLRLFLTLLGETATVRMLEDAGSPIVISSKSEAPDRKGFLPEKNYLGPFENISVEANQLRHISERLETLTDALPGVDELMSVAGNIRNIANALDIFILIRSKAGGSDDSVLSRAA